MFENGHMKNEQQRIKVYCRMLKLFEFKRCLKKDSKQMIRKEQKFQLVTLKIVINENKRDALEQNSQRDANNIENLKMPGVVRWERIGESLELLPSEDKDVAEILKCVFAFVFT